MKQVLIKRSFRLTWVCILVFFMFSLDTFSNDISESSWVQEGEKLIEEKRFSEAEKLANSILESDPSNNKAELILTQAWIGLGSEERKKGNLASARSYFDKAYEKWPLNETLQSELAELKNQRVRKTTQTFNNLKRTEEHSELKESLNSLKQEINLLRNELENVRNSSSTQWLLVIIQVLLGIQILIQCIYFFKSNKP
ncbi:tetratricopeptide repeat protein [Leptospira sarikeiensis]|uniref:Uncharacterized protein n=1 Tax=Leptospira sarikeiensis TaxID=2484943 RepID=A0A4R9KDD8_9LEPT|nr:tetratricopeptide repeat protein [Leptospira sarikeiensis]TGL65962.1 hypothetical protein EHQ64_00105 [Leptospira sarikeiensis]